MYAIRSYYGLILPRPVARMPAAFRPCWRKLTQASSGNIDFADPRRMHELFGSHDRNVKALETVLDVHVSLTGSGVSITGSADHVRNNFV